MIHIENNIPTKGKTYESGNGFTYLRGSASANKQETRNLLALTLANILCGGCDILWLFMSLYD
jgi:hypothetical protein